MFRKNVAGQFIHVQGVDVTTGGIKSGVTWTVRRCIDGTFAAATGTATEDGTTGWYKFALSQADTNGNNIGFNFTGTGAIPQTVNIVTTAADPTDGVRLGLTALPNAAANAAGGLPISAAGGLALDTKLANTNEVTAARMGALTDWIDGGRLDLILDIIAADTTTDIPATIATLQAAVNDVPTNTELATALGTADDATLAAIAALNNLSAAQVNAEVDAAIETYHLDHLLAVTYDPASKPGAADALLNELVESDAGVSRFTANALEQGPGGGSAPTAAEVADAVWDEVLAGHVGAGSAGEALAAAGTAGDPWTTALPGSYSAGQAGYIIGTNLDVPVSDPVTLAASQPATTHAALTVTGALTVSDGLIVNAATTNRAGIAVQGNGTAPGMYVAGGSSGDGFRAESGVSGTAKAGISAGGLGTGGIGLKAAGAGAGAGFSSTGGANGDGILATGGSAAGNGLKAIASGGGIGIEAAGTGADGHGISAHGGGGVSSHGIQAVSGGGLLGHGIHALGTATTGSGLSLQGSGGANEDLLLNTPSTNLDDAVLAALADGTVVLHADYDAAKTAATQASVDDLPTNGELATALGTADDAVLTAIGDLPTNTELATALGTADDAVLAQIALVKASTDNLPADPADASVVAGLIAGLDAKLDTIDNFLDTEIADLPTNAELTAALADLPTNTELATALGTADDAVLAQIALVKAVTDQLAQSAKTIVEATCDVGSTPTSIVASAISPASGVNDQFKGRIVIFTEDTTTVALRGQATDITNYVHATLTLTVTALTTAPAENDTFVIL